jgi:RNA polymerase II subunit A-like phosphatase
VHAGAVNSRILRESNRLALVVDLDKTVLHTTRRPFFEHWMHDNVSDIFEVNGSVLDDISLMLGQYSFPNDPHTYFTKMRPHARGTHVWMIVCGVDIGIEALEQLSQHFELHVYTMGKRRYATEVLGYACL